MRPPGIILAAANSDSGKTTVCLSLLRALSRRIRVQGFKVGPDYIDPAYHSRASLRTCYNLDPWAMSDASLAQISQCSVHAQFSICEGVMGLFDGAQGSIASTAELSKRCGWPVVLIVDCRGTAQSIAALIQGFRDYDRDVTFAGVILNQVGSPTHFARLRPAVAETGLALFGYLARADCYALPRRHLGLIQAGEIRALDQQLDACADAVIETVDLNALVGAGRISHLHDDERNPPWVPNLGRHIAIAQDAATAFCYPHWLQRWQQAQVEVSFFSPLIDDPPAAEATGIFLPGGYPELHLEALANAEKFKAAMHRAAEKQTLIYGECGGLMLLGERIVDANGQAYPALGLLPVSTSFAKRRLQLGYRRIHNPCPHFGEAVIGGHEFHYSSLIDTPTASMHGAIDDARGAPVQSGYFQNKNILGSYLHAIDRLAPQRL